MERVLEGLQFQDRVHQILDQVNASIGSVMQRLQVAVAQGRAFAREEWAALLNAGYTTAEQQQVAHAGTAGSSDQHHPTRQIETTFF